MLRLCGLEVSLPQFARGCGRFQEYLKKTRKQ